VVIRCVLEGGRPPIPAGVREDVAALIRDCWAQEAADRLPVVGLSAVIQQLVGADTLLTTIVAADTLGGSV
jgi:hypothetical protein